MSEFEFALGREVADRVSGMSGIITTIGEHIAGCTRYCVRPTDTAPGQRGSEEFFYADSLELVSARTEFTEEVPDGAMTCSFGVGQRVRDEVTDFTGIASVINYKLWNCPQVLVQSESDADESQWYDDLRLQEPAHLQQESGDNVIYDYDDVVEPDDASTSGAVREEQRSIRTPDNESSWK